MSNTPDVASTEQAVDTLPRQRVNHCGWPEVPLGEKLRLKRGYDLPTSARQQGDIPIYSSSGASGRHNTKMVDGPGVVTGRYGTIGEVFYSPGSYWPLNTTLYVEDFKGNEPKFVYYFLKQLAWEKYSDKSAVPGVNRNEVHKELVCFPAPVEQARIAEALTSLDDKIDLLQRQNQTLEAMTATVFRQWFLDAAEDHWTEYSVSDFADQIKQGVQPGAEPATAFLHYSLPAFDAGQQPIEELGSQILSNKFKVPEGVLLVSKLNPRVSRIWPVNKLPKEANAICSTEFQVLKPKQRSWFGYLFGLLTSVEARDALTMAASGTSGSHQRVRPEDILAIKTSLPSIALAEQFSRWVEPVLFKRQSNIEQTAVLELLRDMLLPKLMSGEVRMVV